MRVNVYAEEMTNRIEIISKEADGHVYTGLRFYLELPVTLPAEVVRDAAGKEHITKPARNAAGPFMHRPGDDDSAAVTFWGKRDLRGALRKALNLLDNHYKEKPCATT